MKSAIKMNRISSADTPMQRAIKRIATRKLKAELSQELYTSLNVVGTSLYLAGYMGVDPEMAFRDQSINNIGRIKNKNYFNFASGARNLFALFGRSGLSDENQEDLISDVIIPSRSSSAYEAGRGAAKTGKSLQEVLADDKMAIGLFKKSFRSNISDLLKSNPMKLQQQTDSMSQGFDEDGERQFDISPTNVLNEMNTLSALGDIDDEEEAFVNLFLLGNSRLAQRVKETALPFLMKSWLPSWNHSKKKWSLDFAKDMVFGEEGWLMKAGNYARFPAQGLLAEWALSKGVRYFCKVSNKLELGNSPLPYNADGKDMVITGVKQHKKALGGGSGAKSNPDFLVAVQYGRKFYGIHKAKWAGANSIEVFNAGKKVPQEGVISSICFINMGSGGVHISRWAKELPKMLAEEFDTNSEMRDALYPVMATEEAFRRSLQAKKKKLAEQRRLAKNKQTDVPF